MCSFHLLPSALEQPWSLTHRVAKGLSRSQTAILHFVYQIFLSFILNVHMYAKTGSHMLALGFELIEFYLLLPSKC